jgi:hypothetical protein
MLPRNLSRAQRSASLPTPPPRTTQYMALQGRYMLSRASNAVHLAPAAHSVPARLSISIVDKSPSPAFLLSLQLELEEGPGALLNPVIFSQHFPHECVTLCRGVRAGRKVRQALSRARECVEP